MKTSKTQSFTSVNLIAVVLMVLWLYTVAAKLYDFNAYQHSMMVQVFSKTVAKVLLYTLPAIEWLAFCLLLFPQYRKAGLYLSAFLLLAFTLYVALAVFGFYPKKPCSCGGLFRKLSWKGHLILNIALSTLSITGLLMRSKAQKGGAWK